MTTLGIRISREILSMNEHRDGQKSPTDRIAPDCIALPYIAVCCIALHDIEWQCIVLHSIAL